MIALRPWLRLYRTGAASFVESVLEERALPLDDALLAVVRTLAKGPVASSVDIVAATGVAKGAVHGALSRLHGLKPIGPTTSVALTRSCSSLFMSTRFMLKRNAAAFGSVGRSQL